MEDWFTELLRGIQGPVDYRPPMREMLNNPSTFMGGMGIPEMFRGGAAPETPMPQPRPDSAPGAMPDVQGPQQEAQPQATLGELLNPEAVNQPQGPPLSGQGSDAAAAKTPQSRLTDVLRGVQVPKPPEAQKVSTPAAPKPTPLPQGALLQLLMSMSQGAQSRDPTLHLPSTLGQALQGRAYG